MVFKKIPNPSYTFMMEPTCPKCGDSMKTREDRPGEIIMLSEAECRNPECKHKVQIKWL